MKKKKTYVEEEVEEEEEEEEEEERNEQKEEEEIKRQVLISSRGFFTDVSALCLTLQLHMFKLKIGDKRRVKWGLKIWIWVYENCPDRLIITPDSYYSWKNHNEKMHENLKENSV